MINDTIYGYQDLQEDIKHGVKNIAVTHRHHLKSLLWILHAAMVAFLTVAGKLMGLDVLYYAGSVATTAMLVGIQITIVELENVESVTWWFKHAYWQDAGTMAVGLGLEYLNRQYKWL